MRDLYRPVIVGLGFVRKRPFLAAFLAIYLVATLVRAGRKLLWYDELFTFHIVGQGSLGKIWAALRTGLDPNPPLLYAATYVSQSLFGFGHIATRLPAVLGFLLLLVSVYRFASFRMPAPFAAQAMVFVALTGASGFAYEARAYGLLLGLGGLALTCWQRRQAVPLAASLSATLLTHCYAALMLPPLFVGELVRTWDSRKVDRPVWLALLLPCGIVLSYLPLMSGVGEGQLAGPIFDPTVERLIDSYLDLLVPALWPAYATLALIAAATSFDRVSLPVSIAKHEGAALAVLALAPTMASFVAGFVGSGLFTRYGLGACIPIAIGIAWASWALAGSGWRHARLVPVFAAVWFAGTFLWELRTPAPRIPGPELGAWLKSGNAALVVADGQTFLELDHYLEPAAAARLVFLTDRDSALRYMRTDCYDGALRAVRPWFPIRGRLIPYVEFLGLRRPFLVYGKNSPRHSWILQRLQDEGVPYQVRVTRDGMQLVEVTP